MYIMKKADFSVRYKQILKNSAGLSLLLVTIWSGSVLPSYAVCADRNYGRPSPTNDVPPSVASAADGDNCSASHETYYGSLLAAGTGSVLNAAAVKNVIAVTYFPSIYAVEGGVINLRDVAVIGAPKDPANPRIYTAVGVLSGQAALNANNLTIVTGNEASGLLVGDGTAHISGDLAIANSGDAAVRMGAEFLHVTGRSSVQVDGKLTLLGRAVAGKDAPGIYMSGVGDSSSFTAVTSDRNLRGTINSHGSAVIMDGMMQDAAGQMQSGHIFNVSLGNVDIVSQKTDSDLFLIGGGVNSSSVLTLDYGATATASSDGWLVNVAGVDIREDDFTLTNQQSASHLQISLANGSSMTGSVYTASGNNLEINLRDSVWKLQGRGNNTGEVSNFTTLFLNRNARLDASGGVNATGANILADYTLKGDIISEGATISLRDSHLGDRLTIDGNYTGRSNASIALDTELNGSQSKTDFIHFKQNVNGSTQVIVNNVGGEGQQTTGDGIKIMQVDGTTSQNAFVLQGDYTTKSGAPAVTAGAYAYTLWQHGKSNPNDGGWYLRSEDYGTPNPNPGNPGSPGSPNNSSGNTNNTGFSSTLYNPLVPVVEVYPQALFDLMELDSYRQRRGGYARSDSSVNEDYSTDEENAGGFDGSLMWARIKGKSGSVIGSKTATGASRDYESWTLRSGADGVLYDDGDQSLTIGANVVYGQNKNEITSSHGDGSIQTFAWGVGGAVTWRGMEGAYIDAQGQVLWHTTDLRSDQLGTLVDENTGLGYSGSVEVGRQIMMNDGFSVTPQMQLSYYNVDFQNFRDPHNVRVGLRKGQRMTGRLGVSLDKQIIWQGQTGDTRNAQFFGILNLYQHLVEETTVNVAQVDITHETERTWGGIGFGGSYSWDDDRYNILGEISAKSAFENMSDNHEIAGTLRARLKW